jgi:hypothetical protein
MRLSTDDAGAICGAVARVRCVERADVCDLVAVVLRARCWGFGASTVTGGRLACANASRGRSVANAITLTVQSSAVCFVDFLVLNFISTPR